MWVTKNLRQIDSCEIYLVTLKGKAGEVLPEVP